MGRFYSDTLEKGVRLLYFQADPSKFQEGVRLVEQAVAAEEPDAFYFLARCYGWGDGDVKEDIRKARQLSKRGIELGSDLCVLGADRMSELKGEVKNAMKHSLRESFDAVLKMAEAGEPMAQYAIGLFYFWGDMLINFQVPAGADVAKCRVENALISVDWFRRSAEQGCIPAFKNAFNGQRGGINDVQKDVKEALRWVETVRGKVDLYDYYYSIVLEYQDLKDYESAIRWCRIGVEAGNPTCANSLGTIYLSGDRGLPSDDKESIKWFGKAAEGGSEYGYYNLGRCYYNGWGCEKNYRTAFENFREAYERGHSFARWYLAYCYYWGRGTDEDPIMAFRMMKSLEDSGEDYPLDLMGLCCLYGKGTSVDYARGKSLLEESAKTKAVSWQYLGDMYDKGLGVPEDVSMAVSCYKKAVEKGCQTASGELLRFKKTLLGKWKRR